MSRYIDADVMIANALQDSERLYLESVAKHTPSIDIVRCKECKHWKWIEWANEHRCILRNTAFNARADDYCSYAERREP